MSAIPAGLAAGLLTVLSLLPAVPARAGEADVLGARIERAPDGSLRFEVTVRHADEGWRHYADRWEVLGPDGTVLAERILHHPHVDEQPFTRSLSGVYLPSGITELTIRAHDSIHGYGGREFRLRVGP